MNITSAWAVLAAATLLSLYVGAATDPATSVARNWQAATLLAVAFFKVRLVIRYFMEVRAAPLWLRRATDAWVVLVPCVLLGLILFA
jgi:hypothetical protein